MNQEERDCLIKYSRKPDNLPIALAIGAIQVDLKIAIMTEFLEELRECVKIGLQRRNLPWCVTAHPNQSQWKGEILILSITREGSNRKIVLCKWKEWETYLGGKSCDESALTREQLEPALVGIGTGGGYNAGDFEWWRNIIQPYRDLGSDEALTTMNAENDRKKFVEHYCEVLLKAVEVTENLL